MTSDNGVSGEISVVIVTYQGAPWIRQCLESLRVPSAGVHVIVVDNASTDDTVELVREEFPQVQLILLARNLGFGRGNNIGIRAALERGSSYVFLLNQDARVIDDALPRLREFMDQTPEYGVCSPLHCSPDDTQIDRRTYRGYLQLHAEHYLLDACLGRIAPVYRIHGVNAAAWFIRADTLRLSGGFDPLFFMYGEDDDLLTRWAHLHVAFALVTGCRVVHLRQSPARQPPTYWQDVKRRAERRRSWLLTEIKRPHFSFPHMAAIWLAHGVMASWVDFLITRQERDLLAGGWAALRLATEFPRLLRHARLTARPGRHFL